PLIKNGQPPSHVRDNTALILSCRDQRSSSDLASYSTFLADFSPNLGLGANIDRPFPLDQTAQTFPPTSIFLNARTADTFGTGAQARPPPTRSVTPKHPTLSPALLSVIPKTGTINYKEGLFIPPQDP